MLADLGAGSPRPAQRNRLIQLHSVARGVPRPDPGDHRTSEVIAMNVPVTVPDRGAKPRTQGRTHIIDKGLPVGLIDDQLAARRRVRRSGQARMGNLASSPPT